MGDLVLESTRGYMMLVRNEWDKHGRALGWMHPPQKKGYDCVLEALDGTLTDWENGSYITVITPEVSKELRDISRRDLKRRTLNLRQQGI